MIRRHTPKNIAGMVSQGSAKRLLDGFSGHVYLNGATFPARFRVQDDSAVFAVFETPGIYFGKDEFEIAGPLYNNLTAHVLDGVSID